MFKKLGRYFPALVVILAICISGWAYADGPASIIGALRSVFKARIAVDESTLAADQVVGYQTDGNTFKITNVTLPGTSFAPVAANTVLAGDPVTGSAQPAFRSLVQADLPSSIKSPTGLGGTGASYPMFKRSSLTVQIRKGDDTADADLSVGTATITTAVVVGSSTISGPAAGVVRITDGSTGHGVLELQGATGDPATASSGFARLVYNTTAGKLRLDLGGGGYQDVATGSGVWSRNTTTLTPTNSGDNVSVPGAGSNSEKFGANAAAAGTSATAIGNGASAAGTNQVVIGKGATATANMTDSIVIGPNVALTNNTVGECNHSIVISTVGSGGPYQQTTTIGWNSVPGQNYTTAYGSNVAPHTQWACLFGAGAADNSFQNVIAIGGHVQATKANQIVLGFDGDYTTLGRCTELLFNGTQTGGGGGTFTISATNGSGAAVAGWGLTLEGGFSGDAATAGGPVIIKTARAGSATSQTTHTTFNADGTVTFAGASGTLGGSPITTTATQLWTKASSTLSPTTANDVVSVSNTAANTNHTMLLDKSPASASAGDVLRGTMGDNATGNGMGIVATIRTSVPGTVQNTGLYVSGGYYATSMFYGYGMSPLIDSVIRGSINVSDTKALAAGNGAGIAFGGLVDGTTNPFTLAGVGASKENATSGNQNAALVFAVRNKDGAGVGNASMVEAGRFTSGKSLQLAGQLNAAVSDSGTSALRSNAGTLEVSNNGGSWTAVATGTSPFTASSTDILTTSASSNVLYLGSAITAPSPVNFTIYGQSGLGANVAGANVTFSSGNSTGNQPSGNTTISTGSPAGTGASGDLTLSTNSSTNGNTGDVVIRSGACGGAGNNSSGSITYQIGSKTGSGTLGHHIFQVNGNNTILEMSNSGASFSVGVAPTTTGLDLGIANTGWKRIYVDYGIDTTAGDAATINHAAGRFRKDTSGTTFTLTNDRITANSIILLTNATDGVGNVYFNCVAGSGSAVITFQSGAPSGNCDVNFLVINTD